MHPPEPAVDFTDHFFDLSFHPVVLPNADTRWHDDHQQHDFAVIFGIAFEKTLEALEAVRYTLGVIQSIYRQHELEIRQTALNLLLLALDLAVDRGGGEFLEIDAHGKGIDFNRMVRTQDFAEMMFIAQDAQHAL